MFFFIQEIVKVVSSAGHALQELSKEQAMKDNLNTHTKDFLNSLQVVAYTRASAAVMRLLKADSESYSEGLGQPVKVLRVDNLNQIRFGHSGGGKGVFVSCD